MKRGLVPEELRSEKHASWALLTFILGLVRGELVATRSIHTFLLKISKPRQRDVAWE